MENCGEGGVGVQKPINCFFLRWTNVDAQTVDFNFIETQMRWASRGKRIIYPRVIAIKTTPALSFSNFDWNRFLSEVGWKIFFGVGQWNRMKKWEIEKENWRENLIECHFLCFLPSSITNVTTGIYGDQHWKFSRDKDESSCKLWKLFHEKLTRDNFRMSKKIKKVL